ncbi:MAG: rhomboid family intramembrane serine protease [Planctomycetes bacterium]|nr:rhomboid family intramembrane serine protease [Planctomycetota bacterium]
MKSLWEHADEIPVTLVILIACWTLALVTGLMQPDAERLAAYGWLTAMQVADGEPWRLVGYAFLHGGIVHIAFNTSMLAAAGPALERSLGSLRFAALFLGSAVGGGIAVCLLRQPFEPVVGASGALFGLLGAAVALFLRSGPHALSFLHFEGPRALLAMLAANLVIGWLLPFVSNTAHIGGLVVGFVLTLLYLSPPRRPSPWLGAWRLAGAALAASLCFASLLPVTRHEWLWNRSVDSGDAARAAQLRRAAAMAWLRQPTASEADVERFYRTIVEPDDAEPDSPR